MLENKKGEAEQFIESFMSKDHFIRIHYMKIYNTLILYVMMLYEKDNHFNGLLFLVKHFRDTLNKDNISEPSLLELKGFIDTLLYCGIFIDENEEYRYNILDYINYIDINDIVNMVNNRQTVSVYFRTKKLEKWLK